MTFQGQRYKRIQPSLLIRCWIQVLKQKGKSCLSGWAEHRPSKIPILFPPPGEEELSPPHHCGGTDRPLYSCHSRTIHSHGEQEVIKNVPIRNFRPFYHVIQPIINHGQMGYGDAIRPQMSHLCVFPNVSHVLFLFIC